MPRGLGLWAGIGKGLVVPQEVPCFVLVHKSVDHRELRDLLDRVDGSLVVRQLLRRRAKVHARDLLLHSQLGHRRHETALDQRFHVNVDRLVHIQTELLAGPGLLELQY